jgi:hypothetical protein
MLVSRYRRLSEGVEDVRQFLDLMDDVAGRGELGDHLPQVPDDVQAVFADVDILLDVFDERLERP